jgi:F-type H+-transporting ATPase subunit delta
MTTSTAANRYARALLDVAVKEKADVDQIERELAFFVDLFANHAALAQVFLNPVVPAPRKRAAMDALTARAGVLPILGKLLGLLAERDRLVLMTSLLAAYRDRLLDHRKVVRAEVTTVAPLTPEHAKRIEVSLARVTGRTVALTTKVDPAIVGGVVARVGSTVYDASVARHLERMKEKLAWT